MSITLTLAYDVPQEIGKLFTEYTDMLLQNSPDFRKYLEQQNYDKELLHLEAKYGLPFGRLYLARFNGVPAGCIGLRKIDTEYCEMKRLYVKPAFRGQQAGQILIQKIIEDAQKTGYSYMRLDTFPFLTSAIKLYKRFGFYTIPSYNNHPMDTLIYMQLDL